jgi:hypothetical protein
MLQGARGAFFREVRNAFGFKQRNRNAALFPDFNKPLIGFQKVLAEPQLDIAPEAYTAVELCQMVPDFLIGHVPTPTFVTFR